MRVELNKHELDILDQALDSYEKEAGNGALFSGMIGCMLSSKEERDNEKSRFRTEMEKAREEARQRKQQTTLIRAKLYQAMAIESEHVIDAPAA